MSPTTHLLMIFLLVYHRKEKNSTVWIILSFWQMLLFKKENKTCGLCQKSAYYAENIVNYGGFSRILQSDVYWSVVRKDKSREIEDRKGNYA